MNVLYASNDGYAALLGVSLYSLLANNKDVKDVNIFILSNGISESNINRLIDMADKFERKIFFINISDLEERIGFPINSCGYNITTFARLFIDDLLPVDIEKILYLDSDIIIRNSLEKLWETDIEDAYMAAVVEVYMPESKKKIIGLDKNDLYYNAGMLLINRKLWSEEKLKEKFLEYYKLMRGELLYNDQDIINHCCKGHVKSVSPIYNFEPNVYYFPYKYMKKVNSQYFTEGEAAYKTMIENPVMIHFLGDERPWVKGNKNPYRQTFYDYVELSGWKDIPWIEDKKIYMYMYHWLNLITKVCPKLRTVVTNIIGINKFKWFGKK